MPFGVKNVGATYQRLMNLMFLDQLGISRETYIDDLLVKSRVATDHILDLTTTFGILTSFLTETKWFEVYVRCFYRKIYRVQCKRYGYRSQH